MDSAHMLLAEAATRLSSDMPAAYVEALACALQSGPASKAQAMLGIPHLHFRNVAGEFIDVWQGQAAGVTAEAVALTLRTASHAEKVHREGQTVELVWTGPGTEAHPFRRTEQAILQVLDSARLRITLASISTVPSSVNKNDLSDQEKRMAKRLSPNQGMGVGSSASPEATR